MSDYFKMIRFLLGGIALIIVLTGCENTVQGFGKDMEHSGQKIQKSI